MNNNNNKPTSSLVPTADTRSLLYTLPFRLPARRGKADDEAASAASTAAALGSSSAFLLGGTDVDRFSTTAATSLCCCCRRETLLFEADRPLRSEPPPRERERRKRPTIDSEDEDAVEALSASVVSSRHLTSRFLCECFPFFVLLKLAIQSQYWFHVDFRKCLHVRTK